MNKGFLIYLVVFVSLIVMSLMQANTDEIMPTVAKAQADLSIGSDSVQTLEKGVSWVVKLLTGATITGIAAAAFAEARKFYRTWQRNSKAKRWQSGPNARWGQNQTPKLRRDDLMLLALSGRMPADQLNAKSRRMTRTVADEDDVELEFR